MCNTAGASKPAPGGGIAAYFRQQPAADAAAQREFAAPRPAAQSDAHAAHGPAAAPDPARPPAGDSDPACAPAGAPDRARGAAEPDASAAQRAAPAASSEHAASGSRAGSAASEEPAPRLAPGSSPAERAARRRAGYGSQPEAAVSPGPVPEPQPEAEHAAPGRGGAFSRFRCGAGARARRAGSLSQGAGADQGAGSEAHGDPRAAAEPGQATEASRAPARKRPRTGSGCLPALAALGLRVSRGGSGGDDGAAAAADLRARRDAPGPTTASCTGAAAEPSCLPAGSGAAAGVAEGAEPRGVSVVLHEEWLVSEHAGGSQDGWPQALGAPFRGRQPPAHAARGAGAYLGDMGLEGAAGGRGGALAGVSEAALDGCTEAGDLRADLGGGRAALEPSLACRGLHSGGRASEGAPGSAAGPPAAGLSFPASSSEAAAPSLSALPAPGCRGGAGARAPHGAGAPQRRAAAGIGCDAEPADASLGLSAGEASLEAALGGGSGGLAAASSGSSELDRALRQPAGRQRRRGPESSSHATLGSASSGSLERVVGLDPSSSGLLGSAGSGSLDRAMGWAAGPLVGSFEEVLAAGSPLRGSPHARRRRRLSADSPAPRGGALLGLSGTPMRGRAHACPGLDAPAASPTLGDPASPGFRGTPRRSAGRSAGRQGGRAPCLLGTPLKLGDDLLLPPIRGRSALRGSAMQPGSGGAWGPPATGLPSSGVRRRQRQVPHKSGMPKRGSCAHRQHVVKHLWRCLSQPCHLSLALAWLVLLA